MTAVKPDGTSLPKPHLDGCNSGSARTTGSMRPATAGCAWQLSPTSTGGPSSRSSAAAISALTHVFLTVRPRANHDRELWDLLGPRWRERSARAWFDDLDRAGVPCEVADPGFSLRVFDDPEMRALGLVVTQQHPKLGRFEHFGTTMDYPGADLGSAPVITAHPDRS